MHFLIDFTEYRVEALLCF